MAVIDDFKARFPEISTSDVDTYLPALIEVYTYYYGGEYKDEGVEIILNLLAHLLIQQTSSGTSSIKEESSKGVGSVSVSYSNASPTSSSSAAWYRSTRYGVAYLTLTARFQGAYFV